MADTSIPPQIVALAAERAAARAQRDWGRADEIRVRIETAGWRIVDQGLEWELSPAWPADVVEDGQTVFGSVASVPSRLEEPSTTAVSVVVLPGPYALAPGPALTALETHRPERCQVLVVVDRDTPVDGRADEIIRSVAPFSPGDALQAAVRRSSGELVIVLDADRLPRADIVGPLLQTLRDERVAAAGIEGLDSGDMRRYHPIVTGDCTALRSGCFAFRREDARARGPIDGRFRLPGSVATWWTLTLRDNGPHHEPRRAVALELPISAPPGPERLPADHARLARRDAYRLSRLVGDRTWLAAEKQQLGWAVGDGAADDERGDDRDQPDHAGQS